MKRFALLLGSVSLALAVACSSKGGDATKGDDQNVCDSKSASSEDCPDKPTTKLGGKKDGGSSSPGTPTPSAPEESDAGSSADASGGDGGQMTVNPRDACVDTANAVAFAAQRCGELFADAFQAFVQAAAGGDCKNVKSIRDANALYTQCIPWIQKAKCADLQSGNLPDTCLSQLQP